jgi:stearoyl-CoA desaturase (delta-9 desaturase)
MDQVVTPRARPRRARWASVPIYVLDTAPMVLVHVLALGALLTGATWTDWAVFAVLAYVRGLFVTVGYHRFFAHRSFKTSRALQFLIGFFCCANLQQGPLWWAAHHRDHHKHSDGASDVHSPYHGGFFWAYCGWLFASVDDDRQDRVRDWRRFPELVWLERFWQLPGLLLAVLFWWVGGWGLLCVGFCLSAVVTFQLTFVVNTVGHLIGTRRYPTPDHSTNSWLLAAVTLGDGWHNNHHHYPHAAQAGFFWWEIDASYRVIRLLERLGVVWDVRRVPDHKLGPPAGRQALPGQVHRVAAGGASSVAPCSPAPAASRR